MFWLGVALSIFIGLSLGLLGGGGSILTIPILIYVMGLEEKAAFTTSLLVVAISSAVAVVPHARAGNVLWRKGLTFGAAGMISAYLVGLVSGYVPDNVRLALFAGLMFFTSYRMFTGKKRPEGEVVSAPPSKVILLGLTVGSLTGLLAAGGGFLIVPALTLLMGLSMRKAVGTSLLVIVLNSVAGLAGNMTNAPVDLPVAGAVASAAIVGTLIGSAFAQRIPQKTLKRIFAIFILIMAIFVLAQQL